MESRKIIRFGRSSYVVSVPKEWVKENKLKKGDLIFLETNSDGELILKTREGEEEKEVERVIMDISKRDLWSIKRELNFFYIDDYPLIVLKGNHPNKTKIEELIKSLVGLQIIENSEDLTVIKNILNLGSVKIQDIIRRVDNLIRSIFLELREGLRYKTIPNEKVSSIYATDREINSLYFLLWKVVRKGFKNRKFAKKLDKNSLELNYLHHMILNLEIIGDRLKRTAKLWNKIKLNKKQITNLENLLSLIEQTYRNTMLAHYNEDQKIARKVAEEAKNAKVECEKFAVGTRNERIGEISEQMKETARTLHFISKILAY
ncbi:MAG: phosphate uptake regulator PhoU [archaeon]|nr:MAG: phosphate uptake regulator PhoU [archaeon]